MPWQRNLAFGALPPNAKNPAKATTKSTMIAVGDNHDNESLAVGNNAVAGINTDPAVSEASSNTVVPDGEIRFAESEWIEQFNAHASNVFSGTDYLPGHISTYRQIIERTEIA